MQASPRNRRAAINIWQAVVDRSGAHGGRNRISVRILFGYYFNVTESPCRPKLFSGPMNGDCCLLGRLRRGAAVRGRFRAAPPRRPAALRPHEKALRIKNFRYELVQLSIDSAYAINRLLKKSGRTVNTTVAELGSPQARLRKAQTNAGVPWPYISPRRGRLN